MAGIARISQRELGPRQLEALKLASHGASYKEIALTLHVSRETVKTTLRTARQNLAARSTTHAVALAIRDDLI